MMPCRGKTLQHVGREHASLFSRNIVHQYGCTCHVSEHERNAASDGGGRHDRYHLMVRLTAVFWHVVIADMWNQQNHSRFWQGCAPSGGNAASGESVILLDLRNSYWREHSWLYETVLSDQA